MSSSLTSTPQLSKDVKLFHEICDIYHRLARSLSTNPVFLPRTLSARNHASEKNSKFSEPIEFIFGEPHILWKLSFPYLRCLWCPSNLKSFSGLDQLLIHLATFHDRFNYDYGPFSRKYVTNRTESTTIIQIKIREFSSSGHNFHSNEFEYVYTNLRGLFNATRRQALANASPSNQMFCKSEAKTPIKCESDKDSHAIAVFASDLEGDEQISPQVVCASTNVDATTNPSEKTTTLPSKRKLKVRVEKRKKKPVGKKPIGNPAFSSVSQAIRDERLFHSVVQRPLCVTEFENGCDSDDESEDQEERKWRLKQVDEEIEEYVDTIAVEKLFMNLWNQFVTLEHAIIADRYVAPACLQFARKYRKTLIRLSLEVTFVRHLSEFNRMGLLDSDSVFEILQVLGNRDMGASESGEEEPRFLYAERLKKEGIAGKRIRYEGV